MHSLVAAPFLLLAQAVERGPQPGEIAGKILKGFVSGESLPLALLGIAIAIVIQVLACWISAKVVVGDPKGSLGNAIKMWLLYFLVGIGFVMLLGIAIPTFVVANNDAAAFAVTIGASVLAVALIFLLPMKVFHIGFGRALLFLVLSLILMLAAQAGMNRAQQKPAFGRLPEVVATLASSEKRQQLLDHLAGPVKAGGLDADLDRLARPEERAKGFPERQESLRTVYEELDARQKTLPPGDARALEEYERQRAKYENLVRVLRADYAASKTPPPAP